MTAPDHVTPAAAEPIAPLLLDVRGLAVDLRGRTILSDVSFSVERGEVLGLVGESGSGKSVTCRSVIGLVARMRGSIRGGQILFQGRDLTSLRPRDWDELRGRHLCLVPQSSLAGLDPVMTIGRQLTGAIRRLDPEADPATRARELLELVEMPRVGGVLHSYAHELSGGMRQRAMIALAIAGHPELLLADEPTTALDVTVQRAILELLAGLCTTQRMGLVIVTHDLGVVESVSDRVAVLYAGMTVEFGETREVLERPMHPYTRALLGARPRVHGSQTRLTAIPGLPASPDEWGVGCRFTPRCTMAIDRCAVELPTLESVEGRHAGACLRQRELLDG